MVVRVAGRSAGERLASSSAARRTASPGSVPSSRRKSATQASRWRSAAGSVAGRRVCPDEQLLGVFVKRVCDDEATRQLYRPGRIASRQLGASRLTKHILGRTGEMPALGEQPDLERGARRERHAFEEIPTQARDAERLHPRPRGQGPNVDKCTRRDLQLDGFAADRAIGTQEAAQLGEVPAQCIEGIVGVREEELGEPFAAGSGFGRQEVGEQRPGFATAGCSPPSRTARHERCPEQVDRERSRHARSVPPIAARSVAPSMPSSVTFRVTPLRRKLLTVIETSHGGGRHGPAGHQRNDRALQQRA